MTYHYSYFFMVNPIIEISMYCIFYLWLIRSMYTVSMYNLSMYTLYMYTLSMYNLYKYTLSMYNLSKYTLSMYTKSMVDQYLCILYLWLISMYVCFIYG